MTATDKRIVIDASGILKGQLRDEEAIEQVDALLDDFLNGKLHLLAPSLFAYKITSALRSAILKGRINEAQAFTSLENVRGLAIEHPDFRDTQILALQLACQHQRSAYDSTYLVLALANGLWFYTGDKRLYNAVSAQLPWVKWIGDYRLEDIPESAP